MEKTKVEIIIRGQSYTIISEEPAENIKALADEINAKLDAVMSSGKVTNTQGYVLALLDFAQEARLNGVLAEKYKAQIADYLEDAEKAMTERDKYKRENEKLKEKLNK